MEPPPSRPSWESKYKARQYKPAEWEDQRNTFTMLYLNEGNKLADVRKAMAEEHGFYATERQWKLKITKWDLGKKVDQKTALAMLQIQRKRKSESKKLTSFTFKGRPVKEENLERSRKRLKESGELVGSYHSVATPPYVEYCTPVYNLGTPSVYGTPMGGNTPYEYMEYETPMYNPGTPSVYGTPMGDNTSYEFMEYETPNSGTPSEYCTPMGGGTPRSFIEDQNSTYDLGTPSDDDALNPENTLHEATEVVTFTYPELIGVQDIDTHGSSQENKQPSIREETRGGDVGNFFPEKVLTTSVTSERLDYNSASNTHQQISSPKAKDSGIQLYEHHSLSLDYVTSKRSINSPGPISYSLELPLRFNDTPTSPDAVSQLPSPYKSSLQWGLSTDMSVTAEERQRRREEKQRALCLAAAEGDEAGVQWLLLDHGVDVSVPNGDGRTPLHRAAEGGHKAVVRLLLEKGADVSTQDWSRDTKTALHLAAEGGYEAVVQLLLERGADVSARRELWGAYGETALHLAARRGHEAVVKLLLEKGADVLARIGPRGEKTALHLAAEGGHEAVIKLLLEKGADASARDRYGNAALHLAAERGHETVVKLLLEKGVDVLARIGPRGEKTALHLAAEGGHEMVVKLLLEKGADVSARRELWGAYGETALHLAAGRGHEAVVKLLLEKGADVSARRELWGTYGETVLHLAAKGGHEAVVKLLLEKGADVSAQNRYGNAALHLAAESEHEAVVKLLLEKGADVSARRELWGTYGETALHLAAERGHEAVVQLLLRRGRKSRIERQHFIQ